VRKDLNPKSVGKLLPPKGKDRGEVWDSSPTAPRGFGVRVSTRGEGGAPVRSYVVRYRVQGVKRQLKLGDVEAVALADARELARKALRRVAGGHDPAQAREDARDGLTFAALVERYIDHGAEDRSDVTNAGYRRQQKALAKERLGKTPARAVTRTQVRDFLEAKAADAPASANRYRALIGATCRWATSRDLLPADPAAGLERPGVERPAKTRLDDEQVKTLWTALDATKEEESKTVRVLPLVVAAAVRVSLLLGTRKTETLRMRWAHVTLDGAAPTWEIPKADRKGARALVVPLAPAVVTILRSVQAITGSREYVFSGKKGGPLTSNPSRWAEEVRKVGGADFSLHALRRTFARGVARLGHSSELVSRLLGHKLAAGALAVTEGYAEYDALPERRQALEAWARHVVALVGGEKAGKRRKASVSSLAERRRASEK
jgi:integrase